MECNYNAVIGNALILFSSIQGIPRKSIKVTIIRHGFAGACQLSIENRDQYIPFLTRFV